MKVLRNLICLSFLAALTGCMSVQTNVESYSRIPTQLDNKTVYLSPTGDLGKSISWRASSDKIEQVFKEKGFVPVSSRKEAAMVAVISMAIDDGTVVDSFNTYANYGVTGYQLSPGYSSNSVMVTPTYGTTGYTTVPTKELYFARVLHLKILDARSKKALFEARATSSGTCGTLSKVAPVMMKSVLKNFPKASNGKVTMAAADDC